MQKVLSVNYLGASILLESVAAEFAEKNEGWIVGISSVGGMRGRKQNYHYGAAKAAFTCFLSGLRNRLGHTNVHVLTVLAGPTY
ncbi:SDR family NAD(P)-dependent oxidoreductase, partial [Acinetobacter baumannii]